LPKNSNPSRRLIITIVVMMVVALAGLTLVKVDSVSADKTEGVSDQEVMPASQGAAAGAEPIATAPAPSVFGTVIKMLSALVVVVLLAYGALYALRRMMGKRYGGAIRNGSLEVLQTTYVGPHKAISLVKVGRRSVLVGVTDNQISTLTELDVEETQEIMGAATVCDKKESFSGILSVAANKLKTIGVRKKQAALETQ